VQGTDKVENVTRLAFLNGIDENYITN